MRRKPHDGPWAERLIQSIQNAAFASLDHIGKRQVHQPVHPLDRNLMKQAVSHDARVVDQDIHVRYMGYCCLVKPQGTIKLGKVNRNRPGFDPISAVKFG